MLIGIDGSTTATGYAFGGARDGAPRGGVWELPGMADHVFDSTLVRVAESLSELARLVKAEHVCIEAPINVVDNEHSAAVAMALIQLTGALRLAAKRAGCRVHLYATSTVRKHFIGQGNLKRAAAKQSVMARCSQLNWAFKDDNQADANAVWAYGMALNYPQWSPRSTPLFAEQRA